MKQGESVEEKVSYIMRQRWGKAEDDQEERKQTVFVMDKAEAIKLCDEIGAYIWKSISNRLLRNVRNGGHIDSSTNIFQPLNQKKFTSSRLQSTDKYTFTRNEGEITKTESTINVYDIQILMKVRDDQTFRVRVGNRAIEWDMLV